MKVFLDTNIFLEYLQRRRQYQAVSQLLSAIEDKRIKAVVSAGCVYTLAYLIRMELKRQGIHRPEQTNPQPEIISAETSRDELGDFVFTRLNKNRHKLNTNK